VLCLQRQLIKHSQEKKRKSSGLLQPNPDRPSSARRALREDSAILIDAGDTSNVVTIDDQYGEFNAQLVLLGCERRLFR